MAEETVTIEARCLCKAQTFTTTIPSSKLPLPADACHCDSCRHLTGALYSIGTDWPEPRENLDTSRLQKYDFSSRIKVLFCGKCSTPMFFDNLEEGTISPFLGTLANLDVDLIKIESHIFVDDTKDGGASMWLRHPNQDGSEAKRFKQSLDSEEIPSDWPPHSSLTGYEAKPGPDEIPFWCKCKGVNFILHRGKYEGKKQEELPWFIDPKTHKNVAIFDACDSCRLNAGVDIFHWTYSDLSYISFASSEASKKTFPKDTSALKAAVDAKDPDMGTLTYYESSPDVQRYFCSTCSACIFYAVDDRKNAVDIAIGTLEAEDGARAESFLSWVFGGKMYWRDDMKGGWREKLAKQVEKEVEQWREERGYPKNWRRVIKDEEDAEADK